jgi:hypothetical protein
MKEKLNGFKSKYSITQDVWTSKNQLSFFGFTIHYIDDNWQMQEDVRSFTNWGGGGHDGSRLSKVLIELVEEFGIADRLLRIIRWSVFLMF